MRPRSQRVSSSIVAVVHQQVTDSTRASPSLHVRLVLIRFLIAEQRTFRGRRDDPPASRAPGRSQRQVCDALPLAELRTAVAGRFRNSAGVNFSCFPPPATASRCALNPRRLWAGRPIVPALALESAARRRTSWIHGWSNVAPPSSNAIGHQDRRSNCSGVARSSLIPSSSRPCSLPAAWPAGPPRSAPACAPLPACREFLALGDRNLALHPAVLQIHLGRNQGQSLFEHLADDLLDLPPVQQQLSLRVPARDSRDCRASTG